MYANTLFYFRKGTVIVTVYAILATLFIIGSGMAVRVIQEIRDVNRYQTDELAFWVAEAGIAQATYAVTNDDWTGWTIAGTTRTFSEDLPNGGYDIVVDDYGESRCTLTVDGYAPDRTALSRRRRRIQVVLERPVAFDYAVFGLTGVTVSNNTGTDSYNSDNGPYDPVHPGTRGDVGTNGPLLVLENSGHVNGDVAVAAGGTIDIRNAAGYSGSVSYDTDKRFPSVAIPEPLRAASDGGRLRNSMTFSGGDYRFSSIDLSGNRTLTLRDGVRLYVNGPIDIGGTSRIVVEGNVEVWVDGDCDVRGNGILNKTQLPENLRIFGVGGSSQRIDMVGTSDLHAVVYAPQASFSNTGTADLFGAVVAGDVHLGGTADIHYDEALRDLILGEDGYRQISWNEM